MSLPSAVDEVDGEANQVLAAWGLDAVRWRLVGVIPGAGGSLARPIVEIDGQQYVIRRQLDTQGESDARFRHEFTRHLSEFGLPVPHLLARASGQTWVAARGGVYEIQTWMPGSPFQSSSPHSGEWLAAAGTALGELHQASGDYLGPPHPWAAERSVATLSRSAATSLGNAGARTHADHVLAQALRDLAETCLERIDEAESALEEAQTAPRIHVHGDFQPHHVAFAGDKLASIYDLDAAHLDARVIELAYALLTFTGLEWGEQPGWTPPLAPDGLDVLRVQRFLAAYATVAPPAPGEAMLLGDAIALTLPIVLAHAALEDITFPEDFGDTAEADDLRDRLRWADTFWLWLDRYREMLAQLWENG